MPENAISNPFAMVSVGSTVDAGSGKFSRSVLEAPITVVTPSSAKRMSLSGSSEYIYDDNMNQGSLSVAGSYGVDGVSKYSGSVSAYVGRTHSAGSNVLSITGNIVKCGGLERIDFDSLKMHELIAALKPNTRAHLMEVLDAYETAALSREEDSLTQEQKDAAMRNWARASDGFRKANGTGIVIGVLWGGWGSVTLSLETSNEETRWKGGGQGNFTYTGTGAAVSVSAAFGHSEDHKNANAKASVSSAQNGDCVGPYVDAWYSKLSELAIKGISELEKADFTTDAKLDGGVPQPEVPALRKPEKKKSDAIADRISDIKDLKSLEAFAHASAYDKYKERGGKKDLKTFLAAAKEGNKVGIPTKATSPRKTIKDDPGQYDGIADLFSEDDGDGSSSGRSGAAGAVGAVGLAGIAMARAKSGTGPDEEKKAADVPAVNPGMGKKYEPMGLWVTPWSALFPWLVTGHDNRVPKSASPTSYIQFKTMHQDMMSLLMLYRRLDAEKLKVVNFDGNKTTPSRTFSFAALAESFAQAVGECDSFVEEHADKLGKPEGRDLTLKQIKDTLGNLTTDAENVYKLYDSTDLFRNCELGGGLLIRDDRFAKLGDSITVFPKRATSARPTREIIAAEPCFFEGLKGKSNFSAFRTFSKFWPVPLPDGRIVMYGSAVTRDLTFAVTGALLTHHDKLPHGLTWLDELRADAKSDEHRAGDPVFFNLNEDFKCISAQGTHHGKERLFDVFPIPYGAAHNQTDWRGCSLATGMGGLPGQLDAIKTDLMKQTAWSFDHGGWEDVDLESYRYELTTVTKTYVGLVDPKDNVMG